MRGAVQDLASPHPIGELLPAIYWTDDYTQRLCAALDQVLAPVVLTLDNIPAYLDLSTAPDDMLPWLARWVGMSIDPGQNPARQRRLLRSATELQGWQGTRRGIELAVDALLGLRADVLDSGGAGWSTDASAPLPGEPTPALVVRVFPEPGQQVDQQRLDDVVAAIKPAHVMHRVQVVTEQGSE